LVTVNDRGENLTSFVGRHQLTNVPSELHALLQSCWCDAPSDRPTAEQVVERLDTFSQQSNVTHVVVVAGDNDTFTGTFSAVVL
jgi:hypothetical protein